MIIVRNERLIKRNKKIGNYSGIISIIVLGAGMYISFKYQDQISYALAALVVGFYAFPGRHFLQQPICQISQAG